MLRERGFILTEATLTKGAAKKQKRNFFGGFSGVKLTDKLMFFRNLRVMIKAGVPLPKALQVLSEQTKSKKFQQTILGVRDQILKGEALSEAIGKHPNIFSELAVNMVRVGEETGKLEEVLGNLAKQFEREHEIRSKITGALMYPSVIVAAMILIGIAMLILVVPKLAETFEDLGVKLPVTTRIVIGLGTFFASYWYIAIVGFVALVIGILQGGKTTIGKKILDTATLRMPVLGGIIKKTNSAFTARTLSSLIASGVPIVQGLEITAHVLKNVYFQNVLLHAAKEVQKGTKLSSVLQLHTGLYPKIVVQMVEVGEETGQTAEVLSQLADFYEEEVTNVTKNLTSIIEPILMLIIGATVGFFAISMVQPLYSLINAF